MQVFDTFFEELIAKPASMELSIALFLLLQAIQWPLSFVFLFINGAKKRHIWGLIFAIPFQFIMYRESL